MSGPIVGFHSLLLPPGVVVKDKYNITKSRRIMFGSELFPDGSYLVAL